MRTLLSGREIWVHRITEITTYDWNYLSMTEITDLGAEITLIWTQYSV